MNYVQIRLKVAFYNMEGHYRRSIQPKYPNLSSEINLGIRSLERDSSIVDLVSEVQVNALSR